MILSFLVSALVAFPSAASTHALSAVGGGQKQILALVASHNKSIEAARQAFIASSHLEKAAGYFPDPTIKINIFGSPLETRNGPQRTNINISQSIPWPSAMKAEERLAASTTKINAEQAKILLLDLIFQAKALIYEYAEISEKVESKKSMILMLEKLSHVVLGRLRHGGASPGEISRLNIEIASLAQSLKVIQGRKTEIQQNLKALTGGKDVVEYLPKSLDLLYSKIGPFKPEKVEISSHPILARANAEIDAANAAVVQADVKQLPSFGASLTWFQIDDFDSIFKDNRPSKDAWAIGASVSVPIWRRKYEMTKKGMFAKLSAAKLELHQRELELRTGIESVYAQLQMTSQVSSIFKSDILPQAMLALRASRESYAQGNINIEQVIKNHIQIVKHKDELIANQTKEGLLKAALEKLIGRDL